jgi:hypothetical protein
MAMYSHRRRTAAAPAPVPASAGLGAGPEHLDAHRARLQAVQRLRLPSKSIRT